MGIDTRNKRGSVPCFPNLSVAVKPHGAVQGTDKYPIGWVYLGIKEAIAEHIACNMNNQQPQRQRIEVVSY